MGGAGWAFAWGPQDDDDSISAIRAALDRGVNWIDTAAVYGLGHSEEVVGRAVKGLTNPPYVFSPNARIWNEAREIGKSLKADSICYAYPQSSFDLIVSNPPYVEERALAGLQREVRDFEPRVALLAGADGLAVIRRLLLEAGSFLKTGGHFLFEIGFDQSAAVEQLIDRTPGSFWTFTRICKASRERLRWKSLVE